MKSFLIIVASIFCFQTGNAQNAADTLAFAADTPIHAIQPLRITNLNPYFTVHVDSNLSYQLEINRDSGNYHWYLKNAPVGLRLHKDNGLLSFKADKSLFRSGRLKYDIEYKVIFGVQSLVQPDEKVDTSLVLVFYNTEIIPSKVKPAIATTTVIEEGEPVSFKVLCETGSIPFDNIRLSYNLPITGYKTVDACGDEFSWVPPYHFIRDEDADKTKTLTLYFIGTDRFNAKDTGVVHLVVKDAINYPVSVQAYTQTVAEIKTYLLQLKYSFFMLDKQQKKNRGVRSVFDITAASMALTGSVMSASTAEANKTAGKILPSVGVALVPVKEATAPSKNMEQNQATLIRSAIKRLTYILSYYAVVGDKDPLIVTKTAKLQEEMKQTKIQLVDVPDYLLPQDVREGRLDDYFNNKKVNKKYRLRKKKTNK